MVASLDARLAEKTTYLNPEFLLFSVDAKKGRKAAWDEGKPQK